MMKIPEYLRNTLEPCAERRIIEMLEGPQADSERFDQYCRDAVQHSVATSLKRIADIMDGAQSAKLRNEI